MLRKKKFRLVQTYVPMSIQNLILHTSVIFAVTMLTLDQFILSCLERNNSWILPLSRMSIFLVFLALCFSSILTQLIFFTYSDLQNNQQYIEKLKRSAAVALGSIEPE